MKRYQIFISSTYDDLKEERAAVIGSLLKSAHIPVGMEQFVATNEEQFDFIKRVISETDYYILIIGNRYGSIYDGEGISYTEKEYDYAISMGIPVLAFVHGNPDSLPVNKSERTAIGRKRLAAFRKKVTGGSQRMVSLEDWKTSDALATLVTIALQNAIKKASDNKEERLGWIRGSENISELLGADISTVERIPRGKFDIGQRIKDAKHDVFISGSALASLIPAVDVIADLPSNKTLMLLSMDYNDVGVIQHFCRIIGDSLVYENMKSQDDAFQTLFRNDNRIKDKNNITIRKIDRVTPIVYFGADLGSDFKGTSSSYIKVQHYLHEKPGSDAINYIVKPTDKLFEYYLEQIKVLWEKAKFY